MQNPNEIASKQRTLAAQLPQDLWRRIQSDEQLAIAAWQQVRGMTPTMVLAAGFGGNDIWPGESDEGICQLLSIEDPDRVWTGNHTKHGREDSDNEVGHSSTQSPNPSERSSQDEDEKPSAHLDPKTDRLREGETRANRMSDGQEDRSS